MKLYRKIIFLLYLILPSLGFASVSEFTMTPEDGVAPLTVEFNASQSIDGTRIVDYEWSVNNGTSFFGNPASYTFKDYGTYQIKLIAKNSNGTTIESIQTLQVKARPIPQIEVEPRKEAWQGFPQILQLDGSKSYDPDGSIVDYEWLVNGQVVHGTKATTTINSFNDKIKLTVTDNDGLTASVNYTTIPTACIQDVTPKEGEPGLEVSLNGSCSTDDDGYISKYDWYASNGQTISSSSSYANMTFKKSGNYKISLVVTDNDGAKSNNQTKETEVLVGNYYTVTINKEGTGSGIVTDKPVENDQELPTDIRIKCGSGYYDDDCSESYIETTTVSLFAKPDVGSVFKGWEATNCHSSGTCRFEVTQDETVTAKFDTCQYFIEQNNNPHSYEANGYSLTVKTDKGCDWSAENDENNSWVDIRTTPKHPTGGRVNYWVEDNPDESFREAILTIAGQEVSVTQLGNYNPIPLPNVSPSKGNAPLEVTATANDIQDPLGNPLSNDKYQWKTSDGQTAVGKEVKFTFNKCSKDSYTITLSIDNNGKVYESLKYIEVNCPPTAKFSYRTMFGSYPVKVKLDATESMDEDGDISKYEWFVDGGYRRKASGEKANLDLSKGSHQIKLEVTDNRGETNIVTKTIEIQQPYTYNDTARVSPQIIAAGISPSKINLQKDDRYDVVAIVRRGINPIHTVRFQDAAMSSNENINLADLGMKMSLAGILPNGDEVYKVSYAYDRNIGYTTISTTWGSTSGQFNIEAIDNLQQYSHIYPYLMVGNYPAETVNKQSPSSSINYNNTRRIAPQVIMAGYSPAKLGFGDTEFDVIAVVRQGQLPIKRVIAKSNTGVFHHIMDFIGELDNGDQIYKITLTYPRGALGAGTTISYKDIFGPSDTQFGIEAIDTSEKGSHQFPDIKFGNYPKYPINPFE